MERSCERVQKPARKLGQDSLTSPIDINNFLERESFWREALPHGRASETFSWARPRPSSLQPSHCGPASMFAGLMFAGMNWRSIRSFIAIGCCRIPALMAMSCISCKSSSVGVNIL
jgi:hypothetical protein